MSEFHTPWSNNAVNDSFWKAAVRKKPETPPATPDDGRQTPFREAANTIGLQEQPRGEHGHFTKEQRDRDVSSQMRALPAFPPTLRR